MPRDNSSPLSFSLAPAFLQAAAAHECCTGGKSLWLPTQFAFSVSNFAPKEGDTAADWSVYEQPSGQVQQPAPYHEQHQDTELAHPGCGNPRPRMDLAVPVGAELSGFLRAPGAVWGEQRWQRPDLQELGCRVPSNLRRCHLSQLDVDTVLNMEMKENLL